MSLAPKTAAGQTEDAVLPGITLAIVSLRDSSAGSLFPSLRVVYLGVLRGVPIIYARR